MLIPILLIPEVLCANASSLFLTVVKLRKNFRYFHVCSYKSIEFIHPSSSMPINEGILVLGFISSSKEKRLLSLEIPFSLRFGHNFFQRQSFLESLPIFSGGKGTLDFILALVIYSFPILPGNHLVPSNSSSLLF